MTQPEASAALPFRPKTPLAMVIERLAAESSHSVPAILAHIGTCDYRNRLLRVCERFLLDGSDSIHWSLNSGFLVQDLGEDKPCRECRLPCRLQGRAEAAIGIIMHREEAFQPKTRLALTVERLASETGYSAASILAHVGEDPARNLMLHMLRSFMFDVWDRLDGKTGQWRADDRAYANGKWSTYSDRLLEGISRADEQLPP